MNRREAIRRAALLAGVTIPLPAILGVLESCARKAGPEWKPATLSGEELAVVSTVADILLPRTNTPGALDVGVPAFIDTLLKETYAPEERSHYLEGLREFDAAARRSAGKPFVELDREAQRSLVRQFQETAIADARAAQERERDEVLRELKRPGLPVQHTELTAPARKRPFILTTRELTLFGFFTSRPGATEVLQYEAIPGAFHGCLPVNQAGNGKRWAT